MKTKLLLPLLWLFPAALLSQTQDNSISPAEPTITLSPFEVHASSASGYLAAEATTGSRYAVEVREIPFPVNVVTSEFLENFLAFDFSDAVAYTSSFTPTEGTGAFTLRGIRTTSSTYKNGIREGGLYAPIAIDRIEVIKGANAAIYGASEPSGLRNIVTKAATDRREETLRVNVGTDDFSRVAASVNQPIIAKRLLTRFDVSTEHSEQYTQDFARYRRQIAYNSTTWRINPETSFTSHLEYLKFRSHAQNSADLPFVLSPVTVNGVATTAFTGILGAGDWTRFAHLNTAGPKGYNQVEYTQLDGTLTHQFGPVFSLRLLGNHWQRNQNIVRTAVFTGTNGNVYNTALGTIQGNNTPRLERNREFQDNAQADLLASFPTGGIAHKLLLTADYLISDADARQRTSSRADAVFPLSNYITGAAAFSPTFPYDFNFDDTSVWNVVAANVRRQSVAKGLMASERASFWQNRVLAYVGGRHDETFNTQVDYRNTMVSENVLYPIGQQVRFRTEKADTLQTGAIIKAAAQLSLYANYSESFNPQRTDVATNIDVNGAPLPTQQGQGVEAGVKASLLNERLSFTAGWFDLKKTNVPRVARDAAGNPILIPGTTPGSTRQYSNLNDVGSHGVELDFNWRVTDSFNLFGGAGWNRVRFTSVQNVSEAYLLGVRPDSTPEWTGGIGGDYRFRNGRLKGVSLRLGARYQGAMLINNSTSSILGNSDVRGPKTTIGGTSYDTYYFQNDAYLLFDIGVAYSWKQANSRFGQRVSVDIKNATRQDYLRARKPGDPSSVNVSYEVKL